MADPRLNVRHYSTYDIVKKLSDNLFMPPKVFTISDVVCTLNKTTNLTHQLRSPEERFFKFGSEPPIKPLYFGDLVGPFYIYLLWMGLALTAFVGESTVGCNFGATSARGRHQGGDSIENILA